MWLTRHARSFCGWALSISRKVLRIAPGSIALVVLATLVSQMSRLVAFFLPLKIVILIGSPGVPHYFPSAFLQGDKDALILGLGAATVFFYALHLVAEKISAFSSERSADRVLQKADKLALFSNQEGMARNACRKFADSMASLIFAALAVILVGLLHPSIAALLVAWAAGTFLVAELGGMASGRFRIWLETNAASFVEAANTAGFFAVTALLVVEFVLGRSFNVLFAIVSLLLARQVLQHLARAVTNALSLSALKPFINAMFFRGHIWPGNTASPRKDVWTFWGLDQLPRWLPRALGEITGTPVDGTPSAHWHQTGMADLLIFDAKAKGDDGAASAYYVKLFGPSRNVAAAHEAVLMSTLPAGRLPAPLFLGTGQVDGCNCHVYEAIRGRPIEAAEWGKAQLDVRSACWACVLPSDLVLRFKRSHQLLDKRLSAAAIDRLSLVASDPEEQARIAAFRRALPPLAEFLKGLPLAIYNPDLPIETMFRLEDGRPIASHWTRWTLEPIGAGWPTGTSHLAALPERLDAAKATRRDLADVTAQQAQLAALLFAFEKQVVVQKYRSAIAALPEILSAMEAAGVGAGEPTNVPPATGAPIAVAGRS